ncbi:STM4011 family radical SAM protein [Paenibacillus sp. FSL H7-0716]|uniref:Radical SAM protein n=2 Tax=Paenibacillus odorifer TaxID=189426 RepID=A0AAD0KGT7_9BACL|nr:STM4011 family radical SAM protein [Paenibacillus odorifer]AWV32076.1 radical SAM protein [Paenibacillus odorifer]OME14166.1 radical SAM protein [Paenibacillus odorifer]
MNAVLYYRGSLTSCNYDCPYCPFGKTRDSAATLAKDRQGLEAFVAWASEQGAAGHRLSIFFNPYGEGLIHRWYKEAMIALSNMDHVEKVAIQTNLSANLDFISQLNRKKVAFWATYHPGQVREDKFLSQCLTLYENDVPFSVGSVGIRSAFSAIASLRSALPENVYLWVNAYKDKPDYYTAEDFAFLSEIDPHFSVNAMDYESLGQACNAGKDVFYVQGAGLVKRCYKDRGVIGNLYRDGLEGLSAVRSCRMKVCDCYIGYIHMPELKLRSIYEDGLLERIPYGAMNN